MKVLDVSHVNSGIDDAIVDIDSFHEQISAIQRAVRGFHALDDALKGKGGEAIRTFFNEVHQSFLIYLYQSMVDYKNTLTEMKDATESFESHPSGFVSQEFLEQDVTDGFDKVKNVTTELTDEANSIIERVQDLVSVKKIDPSEVIETVQDGKKKAESIVEALSTLDDHETSQLEKTKEDLQMMRNYISEIASKFRNGTLSVANYDIEAVKNIDAYKAITDEVYNKKTEKTEALNEENIEDLPLSVIEIKKDDALDGLSEDGKKLLDQAFIELENDDLDKRKYLNILNDLQKFEEEIKQGHRNVEVSADFLQYFPNKTSVVYKADELEGGYIVVGEDVEMGEIGTASGGVGYFESDFADISDPNSNGKIGGSTSVSLIHSGLDLDSDVVDGNFTTDVLKGTVTAQAGGSSVFGLNLPLPLLKAEGNAYELQGRYQVDEDIPFAGGFGNEARGSVGSAKTYAGFDEGSVGISAKASLAEAMSHKFYLFHLQISM